jgi:hypothetical protein
MVLSMNNSTRAEFYGSFKNEFKLVTSKTHNIFDEITQITIQHNIAV